MVWSEPAAFDLDDLFDYIARDSPVYAERYVDQIIDAVDMLSDHARMGRVVPEANSEIIRELFVQSHRVIYAIDDASNLITILAIVHMRQNLRNKLP